MIKTISFLLMGIPMLAQVGIGTTSPIATLDINGTLNVRSIPHSSDLEASKDLILTSDNGLVTSMTASEVVNKALPTAVKGTFSSGSPITVSLITGTALIPFDSEEFDIAEEFDISTHEFTATNDGIYEIKAQLGLDASIGAASNLGIRIVKNGTVVHRNCYANITVVGINVTAPMRTVHTLLELSDGDIITFEVEGDIALGSVDIDGNSLNSSFSIQQIR